MKAMMNNYNNRRVKKLPLAVDLDGTLIDDDVLQRALGAYLRRKPWQSLRVGIWFLRGRAYLKQQLARRYSCHPESLPYNEKLVDYLKDQRAQGRLIVLATAADERWALEVASYTNLFEEVFASDGKRNLRAQAKAAILSKRFGKEQFLYAGNSKDDLKVWKEAAGGFIVNAPEAVVLNAKSLGKDLKEFS